VRICLFGDAQSIHLQRGATGLAGLGHDVHVVCHKTADIPAVTTERFAVPGPGLTNPRRWEARQDHYLRGFLRRFDVVVVCFLQDWGFTPEVMRSGCLVAWPFGSDIVPPPGEDPPSDALTANRVAVLRHAHGVGAFGPRFAATIAHYAQIPKSRVDPMPLGVDLELFQRPRQSARVGEQPLRVGFFKGFRQVYGAPYLMRAIPTVVENFPLVRFDMVGDGPDLLLCKQMAGLYGVEAYVHWHDRQPHHNLPNFLAGWALSVVPSVCESFGLAALESQAMQVPVVASEVGGLPDTVRHEETGLLVPPQAPEALADALLTLLRDKPRRQAMGLAGRALVQRHYEWQAVLRQWVQVFEKALDRARVMV